MDYNIISHARIVSIDPLQHKRATNAWYGPKFNYVELSKPTPDAQMGRGDLGPAENSPAFIGARDPDVDVQFRSNPRSSIQQPPKVVSRMRGDAEGKPIKKKKEKLYKIVI